MVVIVVAVIGRFVKVLARFLKYSKTIGEV